MQHMQSIVITLVTVGWVGQVGARSHVYSSNTMATPVPRYSYMFTYTPQTELQVYPGAHVSGQDYFWSNLF